MEPNHAHENILLTGGFVVDGETKSVYRADLLIRDGQIARIGQDIPVNNEQEVQIIDCTDLIITAGFVDTHVHIESSMVLPRAFGEAVLLKEPPLQSPIHTRWSMWPALKGCESFLQKQTLPQSTFSQWSPQVSRLPRWIQTGQVSSWLQRCKSSPTAQILSDWVK